MQEVFEKIIKKLESLENVFIKGNSHNVAAGISRTIEIVKQEAEQFNTEREKVVKELLTGEWVDTKDVEKYLNIEFSEGMHIFDFGRTVEWNSPPLNGQKITTKFRLKNNGWIPVKTRPMTKEECEYGEDCVYGESFIYECKLPDDNQEVLICTKYGTIRQTTFYTDMGCYFENYEDDGEVTAWMPLPEPYQPKGENDENS